MSPSRKLIRWGAERLPEHVGGATCRRWDLVRRFVRRHGYKPDLRHPRSFNEKVLWRILYDRNPLFPVVSDKIGVRDYVRRTVGAGILSRLYHVGDRPESIPVAELPQKFVVKAAHGSGWVHLVPCKDTVDWPRLRGMCRDWLNEDYSRRHGEWGYRSVPPRILVEEFLEHPDRAVPPDYKIFVFAGRVRMIQVDFDRFHDPSKTVFDPDWRLLDMTYNYRRGEVPPRPSRLAELKRIAEALAQPFDFARVDLYDLPAGVRFGEITLYPNAGMGRFTPAAWDFEVGRWWRLPGERDGPPSTPSGLHTPPPVIPGTGAGAPA